MIEENKKTTLNNLNFDFTDQIVVVTGGSKGLGRIIALEFAKRRANTVVISRNPENLADIEAELKLIKETVMNENGKYMALQGDVRDYERMKTCFHEIFYHFGSIDILINNAGTNYRKRVHEIEPNNWNDELDINVKGTLICSKIAADYMIKRRQGYIINMSSIKAREASSSVSYGASKAAVESLTKSFARQLIPYNVYVNGVAPGFIQVGMQRLLSEQELEKYMEHIPIGRHGQPEEVVSVIMFLVSGEADYIVGETILIDGGYMLL